VPELSSDFRFLLRALRARPGYLLLSMSVLAAGIGAATAVATLARAVYFAPLPYAAPDRIVFLWDSTRERPITNLNPGRLLDLRTRMRSLRGVAGIGHMSLTLTGRGLPERLQAASVSSNFFDVLGALPSLGRVFHDGERDRALVVLSHGLWQKRFASEPAIVGSTLTLDGRPHTVLGVMPREFYWTSITAAPSLGPHPELWVIAPHNELPALPMAYDGDLRLNRRMGYLRGVARLTDGASIQAASAEAEALSQQLAREHPATDAGRAVVVVSARDQLLGHLRLPVLLLLGAATLLLVVTSANAGNLQLMRLAGRSRDLAVQTALGASRARLLRQLALESTGIAICGGAAGFALGWVLLAALRWAVPMEVPRLEQASLGMQAAIVAAFATVVCAIAIAIPSAGAVLRTLQLGAGDRSRITPVSSRVRRILIAAEVATAVVLIAGAGLFGRSLAELQRVDVGIGDVDHLLTFNLVLSGDRRGWSTEQRVAFYERVLEALRGMPGVTHAATAATLPIGGDDFGTQVLVEGGDPEHPRAAGYQVVGSGWFRTLGIPLLAGRDFQPGDTGEHGAVAIVNRAFADRHWPGRDPIGLRLRMGREGEWRSVVGLVENIRHLGPRRPPRPEVYEPHYQESFSFAVMAVRTAGDPLALAEQARKAVAALDPAQPISDVATMGIHLRRAQAEMRSLWSLTAVFGWLALAVAGLGVYGAIGFSVAQRMREFGVRAALGAAPWRVARQVLGETLVTSGAGIVAGTVVALACARGVRSLLFETTPTDLTAYAFAALALTVASCLSAVLPVRQAMRADPALVLKTDA
jgi:putative ABC transport system permease protein